MPACSGVRQLHPRDTTDVLSMDVGAARRDVMPPAAPRVGKAPSRSPRRGSCNNASHRSPTALLAAEARAVAVGDQRPMAPRNGIGRSSWAAPGDSTTAPAVASIGGPQAPHATASPNSALRRRRPRGHDQRRHPSAHVANTVFILRNTVFAIAWTGSMTDRSQPSWHRCGLPRRYPSSDMPDADRL
jgi:hypothetical protein